MRELSLHILDVLQNSLEAGASAVALSLEESTTLDQMVIEVADNGKGMAPEVARRASDPFYTSRTTRRVGLGLPLLAAACERSAGQLKIASTVGVGTTVTATLQLSNIDRAPLGDMAETVLSVVLHQPPVHLHYRHQVDGRTFSIDSAAFRRELGGVPVSHPSVLRWLREYLAEGEASLYVEGDGDAESTQHGGVAASEGRGAARH
ncbi:MAG: ATP-binding protein [Chloroflexi bacterium]|nr:ATP-binding protein [Chloroflexota bacterium]MCL5107689.1 ATP-binding protein [Chloroflexota bacterium]